MNAIKLMDYARIKDSAPTRDNRVVTSVNITKEQAKFLRENNIVLSSVVRALIDQAIREK